MQVKTIKKNIEAKLNEWLETIADLSLRKDVKNNILVSGGCITSMLLNEPVNDYDVYPMNIDICKRLAEYYSNQFKLCGLVILDGREKNVLIGNYNKAYESSLSNAYIKSNSAYAISLRNLKENQIKLYFNSSAGLRVNENKLDLNYDVVYFSPNAISLSNNLQIVLRFHGSVTEIHETFDFVHATNYFTFKDGLITNLSAVESILTKQLKYQGSHYPVTSIIRAKKFVNRGFNINAGELMKIMFQISQLDLSNIDTLEEQLIGVDVAYFDLLITALRNKQSADNNFKISSEYFNTLIDKVFND